MEGNLKELFIKVETHGFTVLKHINWDSLNWVAITPKGSVVVFRDRTDRTLYAVYSSVRGHYHVHIPYGDLVTLDKRVNEVLRGVLDCLHYAECYIDRTTGMVYSMNPLLLRRFTPFGLGPHFSKI
jgi:hypothetical protein